MARLVTGQLVRRIHVNDEHSTVVGELLKALHPIYLISIVVLLTACNQEPLEISGAPKQSNFVSTADLTNYTMRYADLAQGTNSIIQRIEPNTGTNYLIRRVK